MKITSLSKDSTSVVNTSDRSVKNDDQRGKKRRNSVEIVHGKAKTKAWALVWISHLLNRERNNFIALRLAFRTWTLSFRNDTESETAALSYMKDMALVEEELKARDMLIEQLTIKLTASEDACTTLIDEYSKLQTQAPTDRNLPPASVGAKSHVSLVPSSPGINDVINTSGDMISNGSDAAKPSIPVSPAEPTLDHMLRVDVGNPDAKQNQEILVDASPSSSIISGASPIHNTSMGANNSRENAGTQEEQLERLFSIYATKEHIRKSDKRRGALFLQLIKRRM